ncbi:hypothetical protein [Caloramator sp. Dgby_cultured_2]|uniref:hypothetical protein n=1 Tax=Caloramator sp. Dgby_cultured_2 TaxID=3029174 RepID=UPI00237DF812|nr:hypothetical protein [Caloramator sp. Dgby_cultured_2]WDU82904.1 hypothetical protein PWK10_15870 [Caloramator sp. Dgby_cultured_2]
MEDNIGLAIQKLFAAQVPTTPVEEEEDIKTLILRADGTYKNAIEAQRQGDWAGYGRYIKELENILTKLKEKSK